MNETEEIKNRLKISELVSGYVELKKAGANFKGLCPFHNEKTASFMVSDEKGIFHCFGCSEGGDIFTFYQKIESADFYEALTRLGERTGVEIKSGSGEAKELKNKLYKINEFAAKFYTAALQSSAGKQALDYLKKRGLSEKTISEFGLGYSSKNKQLIAELTKRGFLNSEIKQAGLIKDASSSTDRFAGRLIIPIADAQGRIIGFTARVLDDSLPKYINSPETEIYSKGNVLFGLHKAKEKIRKEDGALLVEGNMDVIAAHQAGITETIGTSGTALTALQLGLISRYTQNVKLALDQDQAGQAAVLRTLKSFQENSLNLYIVRFAGKDPADAINSDKDAFIKAIKAPIYASDFVLETLLAKYDLKNIVGQKNLLKELSEFLQILGTAVEREKYIKTVAEKTGLPDYAIKDQLKADKDDKQSRSAVVPRVIKNVEESRSRYIVELLLKDDHARRYIIKEINPSWLLAPYSSFLSEIKSLDLGYSYDKLSARLPREHVELLSELALISPGQDLKEVDYLGEAVTIAKALKKDVGRAQRKKLAALVKEAEVRGETSRTTLLADLQKSINEEQKI